MNRVRTEVPDALGPIADNHEPEEVRRHLVGRQPERRQPRSELAADDVDAVPVIDVVATADQLDDGEQGHVAPVRDRPGTQIVHLAGFERPVEFKQQP